MGGDKGRVIELLQEPAYRHLLLNHIPVIGLGMSLLVLVFGLVLRQTAALYFGLFLTALTAGIALPVALAGDAAYPEIFDGLGEEGRDWLDYHAHLAEQWLPLIYGTAVLAVCVSLGGVYRSAWLYPGALLVSLVSLGSITGTVLIAEAGGKVKHPEFRWRDAPVIPRSD